MSMIGLSEMENGFAGDDAKKATSKPEQLIKEKKKKNKVSVI